MSKRPGSSKTLIIEDDEHEKRTDDPNPFSFKEFIRSKNQCSADGGSKKEKICHKQRAFLLEEEDEEEKEEDCFTMNSQEPFFSDPTPFPQSLDNEAKEWTGSFHSSAAEFGLDNGAFSKLSPVPSEEDTEQFWLDGGYLQGVHQARASTGSYDADVENSLADFTYQNKTSRAENGSKTQQKLREENAQLRKHIEELLQRSEADNCRIQHLMEELHKRRMQEEKEAQDLETMVHSVETNLQLMTKRAVKAENSVSKLKQEILQLQGQLEGYRSENQRLRAHETAVLNNMKQKAQLAAEHLSKVAGNAETSIKQLLTGADTLYLVSQMLCSIDNISDLHEEDR